jgi:hypothetical protein
MGFGEVSCMSVALEYEAYLQKIVGRASRVRTQSGPSGNVPDQADW